VEVALGVWWDFVSRRCRREIGVRSSPVQPLEGSTVKGRRAMKLFDENCQGSEGAAYYCVDGVPDVVAVSSRLRRMHKVTS
jgi:hypothetical protein